MITLQINDFVLDASNGITITRFSADSSVPLSTNDVKVARRPGVVRTSASYEPKILSFEGYAKADSWDELQTVLNALKKAIVGVDNIVDYDNGTTNLRWYADLDDQLEVPRTRDELTRARFSFAMVAKNPPFAYDAERGGEKNTITIIDQTLSQDTFSTSVEFEGTAPPEVIADFTINDPGQLTGIELVDQNNGRSILVEPENMEAGDLVQIHTTAPSATKNRENIDYAGQYPQYQAETQPVDVNFYTSTGLTLDQDQQQSNSDLIVLNTNRRFAQKFIFSEAGPLSRVSLAMRKVGVGADVTIRIETDNAGEPSGTLVNANATQTITADKIPANVGWVNKNFSPAPDLATGTDYWLVVVPTSASLDDYVILQSIYPSRYTSGVLMRSDNGGTDYTEITNQDMTFKLYRSALGTGNETLDLATFTNAMNTTTNRDAGNTTALVDTSAQVITMNGVLTTPTVQNTGTGWGWAADACHFCNAPFFKFVAPGPAGQAVTMKSLSFWAQKWPGSPDPAPVSIILRNTYNGANVTYAFKDVATTSYAEQSVTGLSWNMIGGQTYWIGFYFTTWGGEVQGVQGSTVATANADVILLTGWERNQLAFENNSWGNGASIRHTLNFEYTSWATPENYQTITLDSTDADILSASQYLQTILTGSPAGTVQGQIAADGSSFENITRSTNLWDEELVPAVIGSNLKYKAILQSTGPNKPFISGLTLGYRKGIALDATTKRAAMSFTPDNSANIGRLDIFLRKFGTPGDITLEIQTDSSGSPSGTLASVDATKTIAASAITSYFGWNSFNFPNAVPLTGGQTYWIVVKSASTTNNTNKYLLQSNNNRYSAGVMKRSTDSGGSYSGFASGEDLLFRTFEGSGGNFSVNFKLKYVKRYL